MEAPIYLDHAATTPVRLEVVEAMLPFLGGTFGNPSSAHRFGRAARAGLEQARREVVEAGGTEADNLAVIGAAVAARDKGRRMSAVVASTEHKAVLAAAHKVVQLGGEDDFLAAELHHLVDLDALDRALVER